MKWLREHLLQVIGALALLVVGAVVYRTSLDIVFWADDYEFLNEVGRRASADYVSFYFDPTQQVKWYRPLQGMMWWMVYATLGKDPFGYHLAQLALHLANTLLLFALVARMTGRWRMAWLSALLYLTLPAYALAVFLAGCGRPARRVLHPALALVLVRIPSKRNQARLCACSCGGRRRTLE